MKPQINQSISHLSLSLSPFSEEEIDVVSVGDKILPTNPSARDRRALQNKITSRMANKTFNGNVISRRRISDVSSDDSAYASKGPSEIPSPTISSPVRQMIGNGSRKRASPSSMGGSFDAKRVKSAKSSALSTPSNGRVHGASTKVRRQPAAEMESVERRNLHNDMERQRRIGLKNLFDNLKERIPSLRSKQRAPKVNILREATLLCTKLTQQSREHEQQLQRRHQLQQRLKFLREQMAARSYNAVYQ